MSKLSENAVVVFNVLKDNFDTDLDYTQIAEKTGLESRKINGLLTGLQRKHIIERVAVEGREKKVVRLTETGLTFDPTAEIADTEKEV